MDSWWEVAVYHREPSLALYDDLERREGKGRETREGRDVCTMMADLHFMAKTNTTIIKKFNVNKMNAKNVHTHQKVKQLNKQTKTKKY